MTHLKRWIIPIVIFAVAALFFAGACGPEEGGDNQQANDETPPQFLYAEFLTVPPEITNQTDAEFGFRCHGAEECDFECAYGGGEREECTSPVAFDDLDEGDHEFSVVAVHRTGLESDPQHWEWTIDLEDPELVDLDGPPALTNEQTAIFEFGCSKEGCQFECSLDGDDYEACDPGVTYTHLSNGDHQFSVFATDQAGNQSDEQSWEWPIDAEPPEILALTGPDDPSDESTATFEFECSKDDCSFECSMSGEPYEECQSGVTYEGLSDGIQTFVVEATDPLGTTGPQGVWQWVIDTSE